VTARLRYRLKRAAVTAAAGFVLCVLLATGPGGRPSAQAQDTLRAVAVVNDEVISILDLYMRIQLAALSSGLDPTKETMARLQQPVLRRLIDERLELQEAERLNITVEDDDISGAIEQIAQRNNMSLQQFENLLQSNHILPSALQEQVKAELAWRDVVKVRLVPNIVIADEEIDEVVTRIEAGQGGSQINLSEIYLEVDDVQSEDAVRRAALDLIEELRNGGDFQALANQFSQSATAAKGGNVGWIEETQVPEELLPTVRQMKPGEVRGPVRGLTGYYILLLRDRKAITGGTDAVRLTQIFVDAPANGQAADPAAQLAEAESLRAQIDGCDTANQIAEASGAPGSGDLGMLKLADLSPQLKGLVQNLPLEQPSDPVNIAGSLAILVVCERQGGAIDRERIQRNLMAQRVEILARRYLRDLRREANVDLRL
jgi:peptidyl-prolyl cis-trans isomerase SurA